MLQFLMYGAWVTQPIPLNKPTYHVHAMYYFKTEYSENHIAASSIDTCAHVKNQTRELLVKL